MFDISGPVGPSQPPSPEPSKPVSGSEEKKEGDKKEEPTTRFMGMDVTAEEKRQIYANLSDSVIRDMKKQDERQKKANKTLRNSMEGKDLDS